MKPHPDINSPESLSVLKWEVSTCAKALQERFPSTWKRMFTKSIDSPGKYYSYKAIPVAFTSAIEEAREQSQQPRLDSNGGMIAAVLERHDFPTYYVSSPLMEAMKRSQPPKQMKWEEITLPFPALTFMLPRGALSEPEFPGSGELMAIGVAKFEANETIRIPTTNLNVKSPLSRICVFWIVGPAGLTINDTTFPAEHPLEPLVEWIEDANIKKGFPDSGPVTRFSSQMAGLVANLILVMEARKEWIEPGSKLIRKPTKSNIEIWSPTFIGRNYAILKKDLSKDKDSKAHFTELGWRAGHFKRQHHGAKREQVKTIFVDPYMAFTRGLVCIEEEAT